MTVITPCRPATADEIPTNARTLAALAEANGWEVAITYARGLRTVNVLDKTGERPRMVKTKQPIDHLAVRMWREGRLVGTWEDRSFSRGLCLSRTFTLAELRLLVRMTRPELAEWLETWRNEGLEAVA